MTSVTIPSSVYHIESEAFANCIELSSIYIYSFYPFPLFIRPGRHSENVFLNVNKSSCTLYVPFTKSSLYSCEEWGNFSNIIEIPGLFFSTNTLDMEATQSTVSMDFSSSTDWTATPNQSWLNVSPESWFFDKDGLYDGTITFIATKNTTAIIRTATVTFMATGFAPQTVVIKQKAGILDNMTISDTTLSIGLPTCFNALNTITVAGEVDTVEFLNGSTVDLIAGQYIRFLPGFHAFEGSLTHAYITTTGTFCDGIPGSPIANQPQVKSAEEEQLPNAQAISSVEKSMKVYPNPNNGQFTLELTNVENGAIVSIYNMLGARVYQSTATNETSHTISLSGKSKGIYFVKVMDGKEQHTRKMVVN